MVEMFAWGKASSGQLALGDTDEELMQSPVQVPYYEGFTQKVADVACGSQHTVFLTNDGMVYTCGSNDFGQLGHGKVCRKPGSHETQAYFPLGDFVRAMRGENKNSAT